MPDPKHADLVRQGERAIAEWRATHPHESLDLTDANLLGADLRRANLAGADLRGCSFQYANLANANLRGANLTGANLVFANLTGTVVAGCRIAALFGGTVFACDLSGCRDLETARHVAPSTVGSDCLASLYGGTFSLPVVEKFLRGCGLHPWQVVAARLSDPTLEDHEIADITDQLFKLRSVGPLIVGGVFISYARDDALELAQVLHQRLVAEGASCWLDTHDMKAGRVATQVQRALRINDVVVLILSKGGLASDWVEYELGLARQKEKDEHRDVLCPIAQDDAWREPETTKHIDPTLWKEVRKRHVVDFSGWKTGSFDRAFQRLWEGLRIFYPRH